MDQNESGKNNCASVQDNIHKILSCLEALQLELD